MKDKIGQFCGKEEADKFKAILSWFQRFQKLHNIAFRRRSNKKKSSASDGREMIQRFHRNFRTALKTTRRRSNTVLNVKYGRWLPQNGYNIGQVPLPFVIHSEKKTYEIKVSKQVKVSKTSSGL